MNAPYFNFPEGHEPRRGRLMASGIIMALLGCFFGLSAAMSVFAVVMFQSMGGMVPPEEAKELESMKEFMFRTYTLNGVIYGLLGTLFVVTGFGSIFLKRWSRPFALVIGWAWLYAGFSTLISLFVYGSSMRTMMEMPSPGGPAGSAPSVDGIMAVMMAVMVTVLFLFGVILPALVLWLNWHRDVKVTLEFCDPKPRWTDRCPAPVFGMAVFAAISAIFCLPAMMFGWFPLFGKTLTGGQAQAATAAVAGILLLIAWGSYRCHIAAWAGAVTLIIVGTISSFLSFRTMDMRELYESMSMPPEMLDQMFSEDSPMNQVFQDTSSLSRMMIASLIPILGYLIWVSRYFFRRETAAPLEGGEPS